MTHVELAKYWKPRGGRMWWIIARSGLRLAQKQMALSVPADNAVLKPR